MKVIIPVAGAGTRLKPYTLTLPKVLLHVGGKPVLSPQVPPRVCQPGGTYHVHSLSRG
jgi:UTP-glucose-1-phosphate uridylyltransferase